MADIKQLKIKITSTKNIKKITSAMEVISTIKLQKVKKNAEHLREYMNTFLGMLSSVNAYTDIFPQPSDQAKRKLAILISSEKGLCGSLNTSLFKQFENEYAYHKEELDVYVVGKKGREFCARRGYHVVATSSLHDIFTAKDLSELYAFLSQAQKNGKYMEIRVWYNFFKNTMKQIPAGFQLSPLSSGKFSEFMDTLEIKIPKPEQVRNTNYMKLEPTKQAIVKKAYDIMMNVIVYGAVLHNKTGEFAARMLAMK